MAWNVKADRGQFPATPLFGMAPPPQADDEEGRPDGTMDYLANFAKMFGDQWDDQDGDTSGARRPLRGPGSPARGP